MIIKINNPEHRNRIIIFDYDFTIVIPKSGNTFPTDINDWQFYRTSVPDTIKEYYNQGYGIFIATNQSKEWKIRQIQNVLETLDIPITISIATKKQNYKPNTQFFLNSIDNFNSINLNESFMVGDACGRPNDHSDCDLQFANNLSIKCYYPEQIFKKNQINYDIKINTNQEIIIMVGYPGSGKTTLCNQIFNNNNYTIISGDLYKTSAKMIKVAITEIKNNKSVVFDSTNPTKEKRKEYIDLANQYNLSVRIIHVNTSFSDAMVNNNMRLKPVPNIVYHVYRKRFELPTELEFNTVIGSIITI